MLSVGTLIWVSFRPLLRLTLCTLAGFTITKADLFPLVAAKGAGTIALNITVPSLVFSKIVPSFTPENISTLGPIVLVGALYQIIGMAIAYTVKSIFWVPHRFRYGILFAGTWGNYGDIPISVLMSLTGAAPFNGASDQNLAVAYISAFTLLYNVTLFPLGGHRLVAMDFDGPDLDVTGSARMPSAVIRPTVSACRRLSIGWLRRLFATASSKTKPEDIESNQETSESSIDEKCIDLKISTFTTAVDDECESVSSLNNVSILPGNTPSKEPVSQINDQRSAPFAAASSDRNPAIHCRNLNILSILRSGIASFMTPPTIAILISFTIALINPLKALFIPVQSSPIPNAPDGQPPLAFIMDAATFIGNANVPLGLICLGSAIARLEFPKGDWRLLPLGAMTGLTIGKMLFMPVLGFLITKGLVSASIIRREDKVLQLVCIFLSCVPSATVQVILTQVYSGTGEAGHPTVFLIPQYAVMFVSMTSLTAYTMSYLF